MALSDEEFSRKLESISRTDPGQRGIRHLFVSGQLMSVASSLRSASHVVIATGFFIPDSGTSETDGPPGAIDLSDGLRRLGIKTSFLTDVWCEPVLRKARLEPLLVHESLMALPPDTTHLVSVERLGRAGDGRYYNMRGQDVTATTGNLDRWFLEDLPEKVRTVGIGDGGNEIGMGNVADRVREHIPNGSTIASCVHTDNLIVAGTSNWGAWGLLAALSRLSGQPLLPTREEASHHLEMLVAAGAVDGVTGKATATVDGLEQSVYLQVLEELQSLVDAPLDG